MASSEVSVPATVSDSYLLSSWGLGSETEVFRFAALSLIFTEELVRLYAPMVFRALNFVLMCIPIPNIFGGAQEDDLGAGLDDASLVGTSNSDAPIVPEEYTAFADDRKAKVGDENDVYMLQTHGFKKFRYNSRAFLQRNNLLEAESKTEEKKSSPKTPQRKKKGKGNRKKK